MIAVLILLLANSIICVISESVSIDSFFYSWLSRSRFPASLYSYFFKLDARLL